MIRLRHIHRTDASITHKETSNVIPPRRLASFGALLLALCLCAAFAGSAQAAPTFGISMTHRNAWAVAGTIDPYTHSETTLDRASGFNQYTITVTNTAALNTGAVLACNTNAWANSPTGFTYAWLRNGAPISGATSQTYTVQAADEGKAIQCVATGVNAPSGSAAASTALAISPASGSTLPANTAAPAISGTATSGSTLTCGNGTWTGSPTFSYQWYKNGAPISGATASTYVVQAADVPSGLQCEVIAADASGSVAALSLNKNAGTPSPAVPTGAATATGPNAAGGVPVGTTFACTAGPATATSFTYVWLRNGAPISGATSANYTTVAADAGDEVQCRAVATNSEGSSAKAATPVLVAPAPGATPPSAAVPTVTGTANVGQTLTCAPGSWSGSPAFTYQWLRNGTAISGATATTYVLAAADKGTAVQCEVTGTNAGGAVVAESALKVIVAVPPSGTTNPTITPSTTPATNGTVLTCNNPSGWTVGSSFTYQWLRGGSPISGATSSTYTIVEATDKEKAIQCEATATTAEGSATAVSSSVVGVSNPSPVPPTPPTTLIAVTGTHTVGSTLTCPHGTWGNTPTTYTYQWLRGGAPISGANSGPSTAASYTYVLTSADAGKSVQCEVIAANAGGSAAAISATASTAVSPNPPAATATVPSPAVVSVGDQLPEGVRLLNQTSGGSPAKGTGWSCPVTNAGTSVNCSRSDTLASGESYPAITLFAHVGSDTPLGEPSSGGGVTNTAAVSGGGAPTATVGDPTTIAPAVPFGINNFTTAVTDSSGHPYTQAGGHPFAASASFTMNYTSNNQGTTTVAGGTPADIETELPPGFLGNPKALPQCPTATASFNVNTCPANTTVGFIGLNTNGGGTLVSGPPLNSQLKIFNVEAPPGQAAEFGFRLITGTQFFLVGKVGSNGNYGITLGSPFTSASPNVGGATVTICEFGAASATACNTTAPSGATAPFITNTTQCTGAGGTPQAPATTLRANSWEDQAEYAAITSYVGAPSAAPALQGGPTSEATPVASSFVTGCDSLSANWTSTAEPSVSFQPDNTNSDSPTGYGFDLHVPQEGLLEPGGLATSHLDNSSVTLPQGVAIDPSAADGLRGCSEEQIGVTQDSPVKFDLDHSTCPDASKVGTLEIETPLLEHPLIGSVYLAAQNANPFHSTYAIYLDIDDPTTGIIIKLAGKVVPDPVTGQLNATFANNPELPFTDFKLNFFGGPRASLATPSTCGEYETTTKLTPWSAVDPENPTAEETATPSNRFKVEGGPNGGACSPTLQSRPFAPALSAGTEAPTAGARSPFVLKLTRNDGEQEFSSLNVTTPPGFAAVLKGVPYCSEAEIAAAEHSSGTAQLASSSCPAASQVGTLTTGAGAGPDPFYVSGKAYLAGPYKGAPLSLVFVTPAVAGPFDLGDVVVRAGAYVNPETAQITVKTDAVPQILEGIPLRIRSIVAKIDRPNFALNPTSPDPALSLHRV